MCQLFYQFAPLWWGPGALYSSLPQSSKLQNLYQSKIYFRESKVLEGSMQCNSRLEGAELFSPEKENTSITPMVTILVVDFTTQTQTSSDLFLSWVCIYTCIEIRKSRFEYCNVKSTFLRVIFPVKIAFTHLYIPGIKGLKSRL